MWSPCSPSVIPEAQGRCGGSAAPQLPGPGQPPTSTLAEAVGRPKGLGESQTARIQVASPLISEAGCSQAPAFSATVGSAQSPRPRRRALLVPPGPPGLRVVCLACQYLLPPHVPSSGPGGLPPLPPGLVPPSPAGPSQTQPGHPWDQVTQLEPTPVPPSPPGGP